jgi:hypothetical protein
MHMRIQSENNIYGLFISVGYPKTLSVSRTYSVGKAMYILNGNGLRYCERQNNSRSDREQNFRIKELIFVL